MQKYKYFLLFTFLFVILAAACTLPPSANVQPTTLNANGATNAISNRLANIQINAQERANAVNSIR